MKETIKHTKTNTDDNMAFFNKNDKIEMTDGSIATIIEDKPLGGGGQGEVYKISYNDSEYALKWYTSEKIINNSKNFKKNIEENI